MEHRVAQRIRRDTRRERKKRLSAELQVVLGITYAFMDNISSFSLCESLCLLRESLRNLLPIMSIVVGRGKVVVCQSSRYVPNPRILILGGDLRQSLMTQYRLLTIAAVRMRNGRSPLHLPYPLRSLFLPSHKEYGFPMNAPITYPLTQFFAACLERFVFRTTLSTLQNFVNDLFTMSDRFLIHRI